MTRKKRIVDWLREGAELGIEIHAEHTWKGCYEVSVVIDEFGNSLDIDGTIVWPDQLNKWADEIVSLANKTQID